MRHLPAANLLVEAPLIDEVRDIQTGALIPAHALVTDDYEGVLRLRMSLMQSARAGQSQYVCPVCSRPLHLVSRPTERRFFFRHFRSDDECPLQAERGLSGEQILAMKYDGARESAAHIRMKNIIAESLRCDPDFSEVQIEAIWKGTEANSRRKPDVRAIWRNSIPVAFEVQLSTTFLGVIAERRSFYCREGGLLLWVFKAFDMGDAKLTQDDIYYNNNRNAFAASEATLRASEASGHFTLDCIWSEPSMELGQLAWVQHQKLVSFRELTLDQAEQRAYFFDAQLAKDQCIAVSDDERLRSALFAYWQRNAPSYDAEAWQSMWASFGRRGIDFPRYPNTSDSFGALMSTLFSAREGRPIGWGHTNLIQVAHHVYDKHKGHLWAFKLMLAAHKQGERIRTQDASRNWRDRKVSTYLAAWACGDPAFAPDRQFDDLICFVFPEIAADLPGNPH